MITLRAGVPEPARQMERRLSRENDGASAARRRPARPGCPELEGPLDDATLVIRAREDDTSAFETLVRRYQRPVYRISLRVLSNPHDAADAAQEAFITAWRHLHEVRSEQAFAAWLYRITLTTALSTARNRRAHTPLDEAHSLADPAATPDQHMLAADLKAALKCTLARLPGQQRACWILRELEGMSYQQAADILGITPTAVRGRLYRARAQLMQELKAWR
jgi:RNA polymerase sigma-70 factor, ECF subfamily